MRSATASRTAPPFAPRACALLIAAAFPLAVQAQSVPFSGAPVVVPATIEAENFDRGGEGVAYHDGAPGNAGGQYRTSEDVDIIASCDPAGGGYVVNNFQAGEWMKYTISVPASGNYDLELRAASKMSTGAFRIEVDGVNVTGTVAVPNTASWCSSQWVGRKGVPLSAGTHVLRVVADGQYFNLNSLRVSGVASTPWSGTPLPVPGLIEAEDFDKGGEGVAYHDNVKGNAGGRYRTAEDVDIIVSPDSVGGRYVVNNFETGEWLKYTVNAPTAGNYDLALRLATNFSTAAFRVEVDGVDVTGRVAAPNTGSWTAYQWATAKTALPLSAGTHVLKVVSDQQYFNLNQLRLTAASGSSATIVAPSSPPQFFCTFGSAATDCGFREQAKVPGRATVVSGGRDGSTAVRLHTEPGDNTVNGSGTWERNDLSLGISSSYCNQGQEEWWAHSVLFPSDFVYAFGVVMDFHHNSSGGQPNFQLMTTTQGLRFSIFGGPTVNLGQKNYVVPDPYGATGASVVKNRWYDFVYHIKWSSGSDGIAEGWLNGRKVMDHRGPTLYTGISCYLKLANYHVATGSPSSILHDRIVRGTSAGAVALTPLQ